MITFTSLLNKTTIEKIDNAMREAIAESRGQSGVAVAYVYNSKGQPFIRVKHCRKSGFSFNVGNKFVCKTVKKALRLASV